MMAAIHATSPIRTVDSADLQSEFNGFDFSELEYETRTGNAFKSRTRQLRDLTVWARRLFQMSLSSLSAYVEIADLATDNELRDFAEVMVRQRLAQCRALAALAPGATAPRTSRAVCPLRLAWLRALWNLEQDDLVAFAESAERAESLLEDAFVEAADAVVDRAVADRLYELAINVCGARERFDEFSLGGAESTRG